MNEQQKRKKANKTVQTVRRRDPDWKAYETKRLKNLISSLNMRVRLAKAKLAAL
jgi:hypothetical protein